MAFKHVMMALGAAGFMAVAGQAGADDKVGVNDRDDDAKWQQVEKRVEASFGRDKGLKGHNLDVDIHDGKMVLKGEVDSAAEKTRAERLARRAGARNLENKLTVDGDGKDRGFFGLGDKTERKVENKVDRAEDRADKAKDNLENRTEAAKDRIDEKAKADKKALEYSADRAEKRIDNKVEDAKREVKKGDNDRPFDGK